MKKLNFSDVLQIQKLKDESGFNIYLIETRKPSYMQLNEVIYAPFINDPDFFYFTVIECQPEDNYISLFPSTISEVMNQALENEEYELCGQIKLFLEHKKSLSNITGS